MSTGRWGPAVTTLVTGVLVLACEAGTDEQRTGEITREQAREAREGLPAQMTAALDSGNAAYRREDYEAARQHFRRVLRQDSTVAAAWFGIYMTEKALGNEEAARAALEKAARYSETSSAGPAPSRPGEDAGTVEG